MGSRLARPKIVAASCDNGVCLCGTIRVIVKTASVWLGALTAGTFVSSSC